MDSTRNDTAKWLVILLFFFICTVLLFAFSPKQGGFWWSDASRHAMDGAFFYEFFADLTVANAIRYAVDFYLQYPAISIGFYPPLFAIAESGVFFLTGPSHFSAQLTVAIFYFMMLMGAYRLSSRWLPPTHAISFVLLFAGAQEITFWGRQVMLEIPAYSFLIWSVHFFLSYLDTERDRHLYHSALLFVFGVYTKLNIIFMAPVFLLVLWKSSKAKRLKPRALFSALLGAGVLFAPLIYITLEFGQTNIGAVAGGQATAELDLFSIENWVYYLKQIPKQVGVVNMLLLCIAIAALSKVTLNSESDRVLLWFFGAWFVWGYLFYSYISVKEPRHTIFLLFPLLFLSMGAISRVSVRAWVGKVILALAIFKFVVTLIFQPIPYVRNHAAAADYVAANLPEGHRVMIHSYWDGNFIFNLWCHQDRRDLAILRSDKFLLDMAVKRSMGVREKDLTDAQLVGILNAYGVYYIVCEQGFWDDLAIMNRFGNLLKERYEKVYEVPLETNIPRHEGKLVIYRNPDVRSGDFKALQYDLPIIGAKIRDGQIEQR